MRYGHPGTQDFLEVVLRFRELNISGVFLVEIEPAEDERGFFARTHCEEEFRQTGLVPRFPQSSISFNAQRGTVRGMHFQASPHEETKLVRCVAGAILDVVVDLRPGSATYLQTASVELNTANRFALYIPKDVAHGFQTLADASEVLYMIDVPYAAGSARGMRWNDPACAIEWPLPITVLSERDLSFPDWSV
jgi:dTDP-4-dehydrorhamnose 3,5-epimerase